MSPPHPNNWDGLYSSPNTTILVSAVEMQIIKAATKQLFTGHNLADYEFSLFRYKVNKLMLEKQEKLLQKVAIV